jgi:murein L,D-transpeptidase YcbB/YkuD
MGTVLTRFITVAAVALANGQIASTIQNRVSEESDFLLPAVSLLERADLKALYRPGTDAPLWVDAAGRPTERAREALAMLDHVADDGLDPGDFRAGELDGLASALNTHPSAAGVAEFDVTLSLGMLRYVRQLHVGRVDPRTLGFRIPAPTEQHDFAALLRSAVANGRLADVAADLSPPFEQYRALRGMLARYRSLADDATLPALPPRTIVLRPGERYADLGALSHRLIALGDLADRLAPSEGRTIYDDALVEAVKRFQARHGLSSDGIVGRETHAALGCPLAWRVRQIELALERLRWLPDLARDRLVAVDIPMFRLWAFDVIPTAGPAALDMSVIVGHAFDTETPTLVEEMRYVIFRPYWYVPTSILRAEILPGLKRSSRYLQLHDMEIFSGPVDDAQPVPTTAENLALLRKGVLNLRQFPGPRNPLGLVKFIFPNDSHVYLHGTPEPELFRQTRRDFSHGCVRVEDPVAMAEWALRDQPEWTHEAILAAMAGPEPLRVDLARPIRVVFFYSTAVVTPDDGLIRFADDIYGQDAKLDRALTRRQPLP